jgi:hypothetical protein
MSPGDAGSGAVGVDLGAGAAAAAVPTRVLVFHTPRADVSRRDLLAHWSGPYVERVRELGPAIGLDGYSQLVVDRPLSAVRSALAATRSRGSLRVIATLGRRKHLLTDGAQPAPELAGCQVVDQFHFARGPLDGADPALDELRAEWQTWCDRSVGLVGEDHTAVASGGGDPQVVIMLVVRRKPGQSRADMHRYWRDEHVPLVRAGQGTLGFIGYQRVEALAEPAAAEALSRWTGGQVASHDGVAMLRFRRRLALLATFFSPRAQRANLGLIVDELNFVDGPACEFIVGVERGFSS